MIQELVKKIISICFGVLFSFIGFANAYWGNDPYFGFVIICISFFYYLPLIDFSRRAVSARNLFILKVIFGFLILWASLGVGELDDKLEMMFESLPYPNITGI